MLPKKFSIVVDLGCFLIVSIVNAFLALITPPFRRGFFCNDDSIKYPFVNEELLPTWTLLLVSVILPVFTIIICEVGRQYQSGQNTKREQYQNSENSAVCGSCMKKPLFQRLFKTMSLFLYGSLINLLITLLGKTYVGELRPHFLALCKPNMSLIDCNQGYITNYECTGSNLDAIEKARRSFPSAHASLSMYGMLFLAVYFESLIREGGSFLKPFIQSGCFMVSLLFGLSRVRDHMHHWHDVFAGFLLGGFFAVYMGIKVLKLLEESHQTPKTGNMHCETPKSSMGNSEFYLHSPDKLIPTTPQFPVAI
ncbi:phospholipid phosphatase 1 [Pocillopora verrucosa]|uniref:phospholipid phosphatase 1 n=1 Tax=Pocillopora verrucosa TaxID=203993 RepID=UPI002797B9EA|nr:phospholipid phosphatase 1-like [Pocillopora verrucosa]